MMATTQARGMRLSSTTRWNSLASTVTATLPTTRSPLTTGVSTALYSVPSAARCSAVTRVVAATGSGSGTPS
jgi:hypothetical protein